MKVRARLNEDGTYRVWLASRVRLGLVGKSMKRDEVVAIGLPVIWF